MACSALYTQAINNTMHLCNANVREGYTIALGKERLKGSPLRVRSYVDAKKQQSLTAAPNLALSRACDDAYWF
jgi:hypothetical protein